MGVSEDIIQLLSDARVNFFTTYPCAKFQRLFNLVHDNFNSIGITKEEEGVGICAGASLTGARPAMLIQSTGFGNMINALCSLTQTFELPLLILASWRGVYQEKIVAQIRLGKTLPGIFNAINATYHVIETRQDLPKLTLAASEAYGKSSIQIILLTPKLWETETPASQKTPTTSSHNNSEKSKPVPSLKPGTLSRYQVLKIAAPYLDQKLVVSNIGFPSRELHEIHHQPSNFYMLGSLGLATPIGLGVAMHTKKPVVIIDGDGSLLSNLGSLATIAQVAPKNLTILAIDNGAHGSTGNQPTATSSCVDLAKAAKSLGIQHIYRGSTANQLQKIFKGLGSGPNFIHIPAQPGNAEVPVIPLTPTEIKQQFMSTI